MQRKHAKTKIERSPADLARLRKSRAYFQKERPSLESLIASGDFEPPVKQGDYLNVLELAAAMKSARQAKRLSLAQVASRSGIDKAAISRIETGRNLNPTVGTLETIARAIGARLRLTLEGPKPARS